MDTVFSKNVPTINIEVVTSEISPNLERSKLVPDRQIVDGEKNLEDKEEVKRGIFDFPMSPNLYLCN